MSSPAITQNAPAATSAAASSSQPQRAPTPLPTFVDFSNPKIIRSLLSPDYQSSNHVSIASKIAHSIYQVPAKQVSLSGKNGLIFQMYPEVLAYAMELAKNEVVLEIGGARGENATLLAFAGASQVYLNDIDPDAMSSFQQATNELPLDVKEKLHSIEGDCFLMLGKKPELANKVGLILCRNLIHFFSDKQLLDFCQLLKKTLKPGGTAILTANAVYMHAAHQSLFEANSKTTNFKFENCYITDFSKGLSPIATIFNSITPVLPSEEVSGDHKTLYLYQRNILTQGKWQANREEFAKVNEKIRAQVKQACEDNKKTITTIKAGSVRVVSTILRIFTRENLAETFAAQGFDVQFTFKINKTGHIDQSEDRYGSCGQIGLVITNPA